MALANYDKMIGLSFEIMEKGATKIKPNQQLMQIERIGFTLFFQKKKDTAVHFQVTVLVSKIPKMNDYENIALDCLFCKISERVVADGRVIMDAKFDTKNKDTKRQAVANVQALVKFLLLKSNATK